MIDKLGNNLTIGDYVLFVQGSGGYKQSPNICIGKVVSYDDRKKLLEIECAPAFYHKKCSSCYKVYYPDEHA